MENMCSLKILFEARNNLCIDSLEGESGKPFSLVIHKKRLTVAIDTDLPKGRALLENVLLSPGLAMCVTAAREMQRDLGVQSEGPTRLGCQRVTHNLQTQLRGGTGTIEAQRS